MVERKDQWSGIMLLAGHEERVAGAVMMKRRRGIAW